MLPHSSVSKIIANKIIPTTLEFLDQATLKVVEDYAQIGLPTDVQAVLLIEQDGPPEVVERDIKKIAEVCKQEQAVSVQIAATEEEAMALKTARRAALSALARLKPTTILEDATVPRSEIANMVKAINEITEKYQLTICTFGHAGTEISTQPVQPMHEIMKKWNVLKKPLPKFLKRRLN